MNHCNYQLDLLSIILVYYFLRSCFYTIVSVFQEGKEIIGTISAKWVCFLGLIHWVTVENNDFRIELSIGRNQVGLVSVDNHLQVKCKESRIYGFKIIKSKFKKS